MLGNALIKGYNWEAALLLGYGRSPKVLQSGG